MKRKTIIEIIASLLVLLFVYTGLSKLTDYSHFKVQLGKSPFITAYAGILSWSLPAIELMVALLLVFPKTRLKGLYASFFLMAIFTAYIYAMLHYSDYLPCSCGGVIASMNWQQHLVFNIVFSFLSLFGILLQSNAFSLKSAVVQPDMGNG